VWRSNRAPLIGWLWFLGMLVPVIGLVQVGTQSMADRYAYLPHIGLFIAIVFALMPLAKRVPAGGLTVGIIAVLGALTYRTEVQLATWQDTISVFTHALAVTTHNHVAHNNLAYVYMQDEATRPLAMEHLREALKINPLSREPYYNMGLLYEATGDHKESQPWFEQAIARDPRFADAHLNLANTLLGQHQLESAIAHYQRAVQLSPESFLAHYNFGLAISQRDGDAAALPQFERAVHLVPDHAEARYSYAMALRAAGRQAEASEQFLTAAKLAQDQHLGDLQAEIERQQKQNSALPKPTTNAENPHP
jgi:tetratricopeptide (TPR) repeat protein